VIWEKYRFRAEGQIKTAPWEGMFLDKQSKTVKTPNQEGRHMEPIPQGRVQGRRKKGKSAMTRYFSSGLEMRQDGSDSQICNSKL